jgi:deoxyribonuclease V
METVHRHPWNLKPSEAMSLQLKLKSQLILNASFDLKNIKLIAGADVSYSKKENRVYGVVVVLSYPELKVIERASASFPATFPYIPGLLVFREGPALLEAFKKILADPDVLMFDGHGLSHPRGIGIASHLGLLLEKPSLGVAKKILIGEIGRLKNQRGSSAPLLRDGQEIGRALRTKDGVRPVFVSVGHKMNLGSAAELVLETSRGYRLPEPIRQAHLVSNQLRQADEAPSRPNQPSLF